ncbi:MAG: efflux RND transporter periplasmic adaptor subunit [Rhodospirillales bacterium]|nr:efflux RND transporter periplasmic adaptor subunit [Rhodospirillales bacterium]
MPKQARIVAALLVILGVAGGGYAWLRLHRTAGDGTLTLYGDVDIREVQPAFNDSGRITRMTVQEGAVVQRGALIATMDDTRYAAGLAQAEGQMRAARQNLAKLLAGSRPEEISQAKATMDALEATYRNDQVTWRRYAALAATNAATIQQRDDAKAAFDAARQQYEAARQAWILAVKGPRAEDIAAARATYQAAVGAVALARREYADTKLYAPSDGVVEDRILEPGDMASPATPVYTIALPSPLWVRAYVPENALGRVRLGTPATVTTDSFPGKVYHGWIGYLSPTAEFTPKSVETPELRTALVYQLRVYVCDGHGELRLGMPATVHIDPAEAPIHAPKGCGPDDGGTD